MPATFDFIAAAATGALPTGAALTRAAGPWSRTKRLEYTDLDFTAGVLPPGVTVQRAAGPWSYRGPAGLLVTGTTANTARFDYDPPVENRVANSTNDADFTTFLQGGATLSSSAQGSGVIRYTASAVPNGASASTYFIEAEDGPQAAFAVDIRGVVGGEVVNLFVTSTSAATGFKRLVLTTGWQRVDVIGATGSRVFHFGNRNDGIEGIPVEAVPAQQYEVRRRQLNRGPLPLAYVETSGSPINIPAVCRGLLFEPERTNYVGNDNVIGSPPWTTFGNAVVTPNAGCGPDGNLTADRLTMPSGSAYSSQIRSDIISTTNTTQRSTEIWMRSLNGDATVDLNLTEPGVLDHHVEKTVTPVWQRFGTAATFQNASSVSIFSVAVGSNGFGFDILVALVGVYPTLRSGSHIPTSTGPASRPGEFLVISLAGMPQAGTAGYTLYYADGTSQTNASGIDSGRLSIPGNAFDPGTLTRVRVFGYPSGIMEVGTAADIPRFDHDLTTGAALGLLVEPASTNFATQSQRLDDATVWSPNLTAAYADTGNAPDGTATADTVSFQQQSLTRHTQTVVATENPAVQSVYHRARHDSLRFRLGTESAIDFTPVGRWTRSALPFNLFPSSGNAGMINGTVGGAHSALFWGMQVEAGSTPSTYIPTTTAPATRPVETLKLDLADQGVTDTPVRVRFTLDTGAVQDFLLTPVGGVVTAPTANLARTRLRSAAYIKTLPLLPDVTLDLSLPGNWQLEI